MKAKPNIKDYQRYQEYFEALEQWAEEAAKKIKELKEYANHRKECQRYYQGGKMVKCTCGLDELINKH